MKKCKECQKEIDDKAKKCPYCKSDQRNWFARHPILSVFLALFVIGIIGSISGGKGNKTSETNETNDIPTTQSTPSVSVSAAPTKTVKTSTGTSVTPSRTVPKEYISALAKATTYANTMNMSKRGVYDQLVSQYGEKFSQEAAQYAIDNVKANWNANALAKAKTYQDSMHMSQSAVRDQLVSDYGEKFTAAEADYAIQHLND